jgi:hypothetical protein
MFDSRKYHREYQREWRKKQRRSAKYLAAQRKAQREYYHRARQNPEWVARDRVWRREYMRRRRLDPEYRKAGYARHKKWAQKNRDRLKDYQKKWNSKPENILARRIKMFEKTHGIPYSEFQRLFEVQNGRCAICGTELDVNGVMSNKKAVLDHDHKTNAIRGVLCSICNLNIHVVENYGHLLPKMVSYLGIIKQTQ